MPNPIRTVIDLVKKHEGFKGRPYEDTAGNTTIAYGRNLKSRPLTREEGTTLLKGDLKTIREHLAGYSWWGNLNPARKAVVQDMVYNLGETGFKRFKKTRAALERGDYEAAADEMLNSKWAGQAPRRASRLAHMMRTGKWS